MAQQGRTAPVSTARRRAPRSEEGAIAVEAALVSLLLFTILAGIVDISALFQSSLMVTQATRAGARVASTEATTSTFPDGTALQVVSALKGADPGRVTRIWVYKANLATGRPVSGATCNASCYHFTLDGNGDIATRTGSWSGRSACSGGVVDGVGVFVEYRHDAPITFADEHLVSEYTVMRLEPVPSATKCIF